MRTFAFILLSLVLIAVLAIIALRLAAPNELPAADRETFERANQLYQAGNYTAALSLYEQLTSSGVSNPDLYFNLGAAYSKAGDVKAATDAYAQAARLAPRDPQIANQIAQAGGPATRLPIPLTGNELALAALLATYVLAVALVGSRRRLFTHHAA